MPPATLSVVESDRPGRDWNDAARAGDHDSIAFGRHMAADLRASIDRPAFDDQRHFRQHCHDALERLEIAIERW
jgi:hypothetical protein